MKYEIQTVMHETKVRTITVKEIRMLNPNMKEFIFIGEDLRDFISASPDDHLKVFFPHADEEVATVPEFNRDYKEDPKRPLLMRDYTPRWFDNEKKELSIVFYLHKYGVGADWARNAKVGSRLVIGGPRGSRVVPHNFDGYLFIGDETFIPSVLRQIEEIPSTPHLEVIFVIALSENKVLIPEKENLTVHWVVIPEATKEDFENALQILKKREGDWYAWVGCEKKSALAVKDRLIENFGFNPSWVSAKGYWQQGPQNK